MNIVERVKAILLSPGPTWQTIESEPVSSAQQLYVPYLVILAAIPAVATFIGWSVFGISGFGVSFRVPVMSGLAHMVTQYVLTLVMVGVWAWLLAQLAPTFGGQNNLMNALKLTVYASTPSMVAGVFSAIPGLSFLALLGSFYGLYVMYLGLPVLMKNPVDKTIPYMVVAAIAGVVCAIIISVIGNLFMPSMGPMSAMRGMGDSGGFNISTPKGDIKISGAPGAVGSNDNAVMTMKTPEGEVKIGTTGSGNDSAMSIKTPNGEVKIDLKQMEEMAKKFEAMAAAQEAAAASKK